MPEPQKQGGNAQTLCIELEDLTFETVEHDQGHATVIRFQLLNETIKVGDVLLVMDGPEIRFHGMIRHIDEKGWGMASDPRGSTIPAAIQ